MKKGIAFALCLAVIFSLTGCGYTSYGTSNYSFSGISASNNTDQSLPDPSNAEADGWEIEEIPLAVTVDTVKDYLGYGDETVVVDCTWVQSSFEAGEQIKAALRKCPERILAWNCIFEGKNSDHRFMYGCFWVHQPRCSNTEVDGTPVGIMEPTYYENDPDVVACMQAEMDAAAQEILSKCPDAFDYSGCCIVLHDELIRRVHYDHTLQQPHIYDAYGALVNGCAVCQGYAYAYSYLCDLLGYDNLVVVSETHAWNMMDSPINSNERFLDVTWDDMDRTDSNGNEYIRYDYFGLPKEVVEAIDSHVIVGLNGTRQAIVEDHEPFNYHELYGYVTLTYSYEEVVRIFRMQNMANGRMMTVRFLNEESWFAAKEELFSNNAELLAKAFYEATGIRSAFTYSYNDELMVINIGLT